MAKKLDVKTVKQIAWEVALWSRDAYDLEQLGKRTAFQPRFDKWINNRITLALKNK